MALCAGPEAGPSPPPPHLCSRWCEWQAVRVLLFGCKYWNRFFHSLCTQISHPSYFTVEGRARSSIRLV